MRVLAVVLAATVLVGGCSSDAPRPVTPTMSPAIPADPSATADVPGEVACDQLATAVRDGTLMNPGVVDAVASAGVNADAPVADSGQRLAQAYAQALTASGTDAEPDAIAAVSAAAAMMAKVCEEGGFGTVG